MSNRISADLKHKLYASGKNFKGTNSIVANVNGNTFSLELGVDNKIWHY